MDFRAIIRLKSHCTLPKTPAIPFYCLFSQKNHIISPVNLVSDAHDDIRALGNIARRNNDGPDIFSPHDLKHMEIRQERME